MQMMQRAKMSGEQELTLREYCDLVWRTGEASPLDNDGPVEEKEEKIPDYFDEEEAGDKIEL